MDEETKANTNSAGEMPINAANSNANGNTELRSDELWANDLPTSLSDFGFSDSQKEWAYEQLKSVMLEAGLPLSSSQSSSQA